MISKKEHWEHIYATKAINEVSWYQEKPETSLALIKNISLNKAAKIIDIGGGDGLMVDELIEMQFKDISVLDLSQNAIDKAVNRLGKSAQNIEWINTNIIDFEPQKKFNLWHDRAVFHFLTAENEIEKYVALTGNSIEKDGYLILATFSSNGPTKCSGIDIKQYDVADLLALFGPSFSLVQHLQQMHSTPLGTQQEFTFAVFQKN